ncbi:MAG: electron transfer flavoprotein subunit alpha/FixB family protein [Oscillospiraceae bacterium]|jgi:electron transfer flavoprotein alpha subunit|nr:electron transfer flavoprotein subunit alpha/FixB family protein [Oscillospiraceae bacterium]
MILTNEIPKEAYRNIWILAEMNGEAISPVTHELLGAARGLAEARGADVVAVVLGSGFESTVEDLAAYGADSVIYADDKRLAAYNDELEANLLTRLIKAYRPEVFLGAATARGRALIPRLAVKTVSGLTADCTELTIDAETGELHQTRPAFGGNLMATIKTPNHRPQMATVRPRVMKALDPDYTRSLQSIVREEILPEETENIKRILETVREHQGAVNLGDAQIIVSGGRAMKGPEGFKMLQALADKLGAAVGASRPCIDAGWMPYAHQIGQTGQTVQTKLYIACGISGQIQHLVGMQGCDTIIAIDKNPNTPLMQMADVAVCGDVFEIVPELTKLL